MAHASVTVSAEAGGGGVGESSLAGTAAGLWGWGVPQGRAFPIAARARAGFQGRMTWGDQALVNKARSFIFNRGFYTLSYT